MIESPAIRLDAVAYECGIQISLHLVSANEFRSGIQISVNVYIRNMVILGRFHCSCVESIRSLWRYAKSLNDELAKKIANAIVDFAILHSAEVLVFEYLDFAGKRAKGSKKQKLQMWRKNGIQAYATHKAHRCAMHVSHICAWNTSRLAFDGSGMLERSNKNRAIATFQNGKQYNCDLNASYNIGARYYIRELPKTLPAKDRSQLLAKDQVFGRRTSATLSTLKMLYPEWCQAATEKACSAGQVA